MLSGMTALYRIWLAFVLIVWVAVSYFVGSLLGTAGLILATIVSYVLLIGTIGAWNESRQQRQPRSHTAPAQHAAGSKAS